MIPPKSPKARVLQPFAALFVALAGCVTVTDDSTTPRRGLETSVSTLSNRLLDVAELRTDLSSMRTYIEAICAASHHDDADPIALALQKEFLLALANHMYVVDGGAGDPGVPPGTTHVLTGDYVLRGDQLLLSVRLVDADSQVIVAATRGTVPVVALGEAAPKTRPLIAAEVPSEPVRIPEHAEAADATVSSERVHSSVPTVPADAVVSEKEANALEPLVAKQGGLHPRGGLTEAETTAAEPGAFEESFEDWRERMEEERRIKREAEAAREAAVRAKLKQGESELSPKPRQPLGADSRPETFEEWRARKIREQGSVLPKGETLSPKSPTKQTIGADAPSAETLYPWRTQQLADLLGVPATQAGPAASSGKAEGRPWRTTDLARLLGVPAKN